MLVYKNAINRKRFYIWFRVDSIINTWDFFKISDHRGGWATSGVKAPLRPQCRRCHWAPAPSPLAQPLHLASLNTVSPSETPRAGRPLEAQQTVSPTAAPLHRTPQAGSPRLLLPLLGCCCFPASASERKVWSVLLKRHLLELGSDVAVPGTVLMLGCEGGGDSPVLTTWKKDEGAAGQSPLPVLTIGPDDHFRLDGGGSSLQIRGLYLGWLRTTLAGG